MQLGIWMQRGNNTHNQYIHTPFLDFVSDLTPKRSKERCATKNEVLHNVSIGMLASLFGGLFTTPMCSCKLCADC